MKLPMVHPANLPRPWYTLTLGAFHMPASSNSTLFSARDTHGTHLSDTGGGGHPRVSVPGSFTLPFNSRVNP